MRNEGASEEEKGEPEMKTLSCFESNALSVQ